MERVKSNVGKGFGWENPINLMDSMNACMHFIIQQNISDRLFFIIFCLLPQPLLRLIATSCRSH